MKIYEILREAEAVLDIEKDDDKMTTLVDKTTGVRTTIDKKNPKSPKLGQDATGKYTLQAPTPGTPPKPANIKPGTKVTLQQK
jgi:hypothetical protein